MIVPPFKGKKELNCNDDNVEEFREYGFHSLLNLPVLFAVATLVERSIIFGSPFPKKLIFKDGSVRTACFESAISELIKPGKDLGGNKKGSAKIFALPFGQVDLTDEKSNQLLERLKQIHFKYLTNTAQKGIIQP